MILWDTLGNSCAPAPEYCATFKDVLAYPKRPRVIAIDVPIGLLDQGVHGGRECDREARKELGKHGVRVFSAPTRPALDQYRLTPGDYRQISAANAASSSAGPGLTRQTVSIMNKIDEVDREMALADTHARVYEIHPEVSFTRANNGSAIPTAKRYADGRRVRQVLLESLGFPVAKLLSAPRELRCRADDILDAAIACWTARMISESDASSLPATRPSDSRGIPMAIWR